MYISLSYYYDFLSVNKISVCLSVWYTATMNIFIRTVGECKILTSKVVPCVIRVESQRLEIYILKKRLKIKI